MKAFFFSRHLREKLLLIVLLAMIAVSWLTSVAGRGQPSGVNGGRRPRC